LEEINMDAILPTAREIHPLEKETMWRVAWRLMPLLMCGFFCSSLDRANVGMAALTMNKQLGFSSAVFGFGAGVFFFGYFLAEIPSNLVLNKVGARLWIARIMITWGIISGLTAFVWSDWSFYIVRFFLGLSEGGFFPGAILFMTWWFPSYYRGRMFAMFSSAAVVSLFIGPPIGGLLMLMNGILGLAGWQWLFIMEALPAIVMAVVMFQMLTDRPAEATWLRPDQRTWLAERLASERTQREAVHKYSLGEAFCNPKIWLLSVAWFGQNVATYGLVIFMPLIVKGLGASTNMIGLVSAVPYVFALVGMNYWGWHSDRTGERTWHAAGAWLVCAAGMGTCILIGTGHPVLMMLALIVAATACPSANPVFWALPTALLSGAAAAGGIAMINAIGNLGGWLGPWMFGLVKDATGSDSIALLCLALAPVMSAVVILLVGHDRRLERIPPRR
jgi:ACS family tartrate transporter-like MFS transporter